MHLIMELCTGGDLFDRVVDKAHDEDGRGCYSELDAKVCSPAAKSPHAKVFGDCMGSLYFAAYLSPLIGDA